MNGVRKVKKLENWKIAKLMRRCGARVKMIVQVNRKRPRETQS